MKTVNRNAANHIDCTKPGSLDLVSEHEVRSLQAAVARGDMPPDLQTKLAGLVGEDIVQHNVSQKTLLFLALLAAVQEGTFRDVTPAQQQRLLRVVAYVGKDDDAIADTREGGYTDDLSEVRAAVGEMAGLLNRFTNWRLQQQVPILWGALLKTLGETACQAGTRRL